MRNQSEHSDPNSNPNFLRRWTEADDAFDIRTDTERRRLEHVSAPAGRVIRRVEKQRVRSEISRLLMAAQQANGSPAVVVGAFREADRLRREIGETWAGLVAGRAA